MQLCHADTLSRGLEGDAFALRQLIATLTPVVRARVARISSHRRLAAHDADDLAQEVFARLFADERSVLRAWSPAKGLSLLNYVGLVAERCVLALLRRRRFRPIADAPLQVRDAGAGPDCERPVVARQLLSRLMARMEAELSDTGLTMLRLLFVEDRSVEAVCAATGASRDAVYAWRSRLRRHARVVRASLEA